MSSEKKFRIQNGLDVAGEVFVNGINIVGADGVLNEASYQTAVQAMIDTTVAQGVDQGSIDSAVSTAVAALADSAPETLDTLNELAAALGDDADFATSMTNALNTKLNVANNLSDVADAAAARSNLGLGTAATAATTSFATAAQGTKADNAATQADLDTLQATINAGVATTAQGALADTAVQPEDFGTGITTETITTVDPSTVQSITNVTSNGSKISSIANESGLYHAVIGNGNGAFVHYNAIEFIVYLQDSNSYNFNLNNMGVSNYGNTIFERESFAIDSTHVWFALVGQGGSAGSLYVYKLDLSTAGIEVFNIGSELAGPDHIDLSQAHAVDGYYYLGGRTNVGAWNAKVLKIDGSGNVVSTHTGPGGQTANMIPTPEHGHVDATGGILITTGGGQPPSQIFAEDLSNPGTFLWTFNKSSLGLSNNPWSHQIGTMWHSEKYVVVQSRRSPNTSKDYNQYAKMTVLDRNTGAIVSTITNNYGSHDYMFGSSVVVIGDYVIVGAVQDSPPDTNTSGDFKNSVYSALDGSFLYDIDSSERLNLVHKNADTVNATVQLSNTSRKEIEIKFNSQVDVTVIADTDVMATRAFAESAVAGVDLTNYSNTTAMNTAIATAVANADVDLSGYSTTAEMNSAITAEVANVVDAAPAALDTLNELAAALGDDANFASTMTTALAGKATTSDLQTLQDSLGISTKLYVQDSAPSTSNSDEIWIDSTDGTVHKSVSPGVTGPNLQGASASHNKYGQLETGSNGGFNITRYGYWGSGFDHLSYNVSKASQLPGFEFATPVLLSDLDTQDSGIFPTWILYEDGSTEKVGNDSGYSRYYTFTNGKKVKGITFGTFSYHGNPPNNNVTLNYVWPQSSEWTQVSSVDTDLSPYSTTTEMNSAIATAVANADVDLSGYSTTAEMNTAITAEVANVVDAAPAALDTLNELAAALGDDANFASTVTTSLAAKADTSAVATTAQGALADTAVQPEEFGVGISTVSTTNTDLSVQPSVSSVAGPSNGEFYGNPGTYREDTFVTNGTVSAITSGSGITIFDTATGTQLYFFQGSGSLGHSGAYIGAPLAINSTTLFVVTYMTSGGANNAKLHRINLSDGTYQSSTISTDLGDNVLDMALRGNYLYLSARGAKDSNFNRQSVLLTFDITTGSQTNTVTKESTGGMWGNSFAIEGNILAVANNGAGELTVINIPDGWETSGSTNLIYTIQKPAGLNFAYRVEVSDGKIYVYSETTGWPPSQIGSIHVYDVTDGSLITSYSSETSSLNFGSDFSVMGTVLLVSETNGTVATRYLLDLSTDLRYEITESFGTDENGRCTNDGTSFYVVGSDGVYTTVSPSGSTSHEYSVDDSIFATKDYVDSGVSGVDLSGYTDTSDMTTAIATAQTAAEATAAADATAKADAAQAAAIASASADATAKADQAETDAKAYADQVVAATVDAAPAALDTLNELAAALGDDENFASTVTTSIATKADAAATTTALDSKVGLAEVDVRMEPIKQLAESAIQAEDFGSGISLFSQTLVNWSSDSVLQNPTTIDAPSSVTSDAWAYGSIIANNSTKWATNDWLHDGDKGRVYVFNQSDNSLAFTLDGTSSNERMGSIGLIMNDEYIVAGAYNYNGEHGRVHVFSAVDGSPLYILEPDSTPNPWNRFEGRFGGKGLALEGSNLYVGCTEDITIGDGNVNGQSAAGAVYHFDLSTGNKVSRIENPIAEGYANNNWFGKEISVHGNNVYVSYGSTHGGLHHYTLSGSTLTLQNSFEFGGISGVGSGANSQFGQQTDTNGTYFIAYAPMNQGDSGEFGVIVYKNEDLHNGVFEPVYNIDTTHAAGGLLFIDGNVIAAGVGSNDSIRIYTLGDTLSEVVVGQTLSVGNIYSAESISGGAKPFAYLSGSSKFIYRTEVSSTDIGMYDVVSSSTSSYVVDASVFATKDYVDSGVVGVDLSGYSTTAEMDSAIAAIPATDLTPYSTTTEMNTAISNVSVDLSGYSTTTAINAAFATKLAEANAYSDQVVAATVDAAPAALDTLNELAAALGDDANFASTVTASIATKADDAATTAALADKASQVDLTAETTRATSAETINNQAIAILQNQVSGISTSSGSTDIQMTAEVDMDSNNIKNANDVYAARGFIDTIEADDLKVQTGTADFEGSTVNFGSATIIGSGFSTASNNAVDNHINVSTANAGEFVKWNGTDYEWTDYVSGRLASDNIELDNGGSFTAGVSATLDFQNGLVKFDGSEVIVDTPTAPTHAANKSYVDGVVAATVDAAPAALDTLNELAAALGDDANFASTMTNSLATKANTADVATAAQGVKADSALQPGDAVSLTVDNSDKLDGQQSSHFRIDIYDINGNIVN